MITTLTTIEELDNLGSAFTMEGLLESSIPDLFDWIEKITPMKNRNAYVIKGKTMNEVYGLTGNNAYLDDCTLVAIMLDDIESPMKLAIPRFQIGARWFDDIVANNAARQQEIESEFDMEG